MNTFVSKASRALVPLLAVLAVAFATARATAQIATNIDGLSYTGLNSSGGLQSAGGTDANWTVTYASTDGGNSVSTANEGAAYVVSASSISGSGYTSNTSTAQWITAPGAYATASTSSAQNSGGLFLPGNGNTGSNEGIYVYTVAFYISGTGAAGTVTTSNIQITMTLAADDQYSVYVNPAGNGTTLPTGTASASQTSAWSNKTAITLQNYGTGGANNATFVIGTNYISIVVDNTNSITGSSTSTALNASGLLVYQTATAKINGKTVPEVATWLPLAGVILCYGFFVARRRRTEPAPLAA